MESKLGEQTDAHIAYPRVVQNSISSLENIVFIEYFDWQILHFNRSHLKGLPESPYVKSPGVGGGSHDTNFYAII